MLLGFGPLWALIIEPRLIPGWARLPRALQWFTGNIGLHHVHHLDARIPNYNLQRAHDENPIFHDVHELTMWQAVLALRLKLIDGRSGRLVSLAEARA